MDGVGKIGNKTQSSYLIIFVKFNMNKFVLMVVLLIAGSVCAEEPAKDMTAATRMAPKLEVQMNCDECSGKYYAAESLIQIADAYNKYVEKHGGVISDKDEMVFKIGKYNARKTRLLGVFGGKDVISGVADYAGKTFKAENYYINAVLGIEDVAKSVGEDLAKQVLN